MHGNMNLSIASNALVYACMSESLSPTFYTKFGLSLPLSHQVRLEPPSISVDNGLV